MATEEENRWRAAAAAYNNGEGIPLEEADPDDKEEMQALYRALQVNDFAAKMRLRQFIRRLRQQQQVLPTVQEQQPLLSQLSEKEVIGFKFMLDAFAKKRGSIELSEVTMKTKNEFTRSMGLPEATAVWPNKPDLSQSIEKGYPWRESSEDSAENRSAYMAYLKELLKLPNGYDLGDVQPNRSLLSVSVDLPMETSESRTVNGTTDVIITKSEYIHGNTIRNNIQVLFELKKDDNMSNKDYTPQAICELIAAACLNEGCPVVAVLTDLNKSWTFFWFAIRKDDSRMALYRLPLKGEKSVAEAKYLLGSLYDHSSPRDKLPTTFADRQSYEDVLLFVQNVQNKKQRMWSDRDDGNSLDQDTEPSSSDGADRPSNPGTGGGFSSTSRGRGNQAEQGDSGGGGGVPMNMASTLSLFAPPAYRDVANELDLLDFVDVDEQYEIVRSFAEKHIVPYMRAVE